MTSIATDALPILSLFASAFTAPTFQRAQLLAVAAILTTGRRTVSNLLRTVAFLAQGASSSYHRVLSQALWSGLRLAALLARFILCRFYPAGPIPLVGDDTVCEHRGKKVHGKGRHREHVDDGRHLRRPPWPGAPLSTRRGRWYPRWRCRRCRRSGARCSRSRG